MAKIAIQGNPAGTGTITFQPPNTNTNRTVSLPDVDGTMAVAEQASVPIGSLLWVTGTSAPLGYVAANGQLLDRSTYPALWAYAQASGNIVVEGSWTKGKYSSGNGSTSFRVPDLRDQFIRGSSGARAVGHGEEDTFKAHTHTVGEHNNAGSSNTNPAVLQVGSSATAVLGQGATTSTGGDETRPKNISYLPCIRAYDILTNPELLNAAGVVSQVNSLEVSKLNKSDNIVLGASVVASGTAVDFVGIPEGVKRVTVMFDGVSTSGTSEKIIQLGTLNGIEILNYVGACSYLAGSGTTRSAYSTGFGLRSIVASDIIQGCFTLSKVGSNNVFCGFGILGAAIDTIFHSAGSKSLSSPLDRIRITTVNSTDKFDAGTINISWEF